MGYFEEAVKLATEKFYGLVDKGKKPYMGHLLRVMGKMPDDESRTVAVLHDIIEDTDVDADQLRKVGIPGHLIEAVLVLTKDESRKGEEGYYDEYVGRIAANPLARKVKLADLEDNMDITRLNEIKDGDFERLKKYHKAWKRLHGHG